MLKLNHGWRCGAQPAASRSNYELTTGRLVAFAVIVTITLLAALLPATL